MENMIRFQNIVKKYGEKTIIDDLCLDVKRGEFVTIIGSSGCGKTTLLKTVNGLVEPNEGDVLVNGASIKDVDLISLRRRIGYSIQGNLLFPHMTVEENILYVPHLIGKHKKKRETAIKWMRMLRLDEELLSRFPDQLSGGQQQRVGIARALAAEPEILLMDEPFGAVDEITREQLGREIKEIHQKEKITILFVTHDIDEALYLGTKVLVLDQGLIQQYDSPTNLITHPANEFVRKLIGHRQMAQSV
ncbi:ATP-binding cassette domain-containing protein [Lachnoclostridium sp. An181]|uniref:ATP-binding cassette domain-containing protein n=1 Tax=Lachnoclostridium sp. An181 TaxID=1965575 RepID=UPI000B3A7CD7|nr:ABC transporter ATP-binding protein [Lachnoclostridium sp. An181]OUP48720.1 glycine/betaine ABC transporter ATP-binding protein [Lachnoclostridium sp. An181]